MKKNNNFLTIILVVLIIAALAGIVFIVYGLIKNATYKAQNPIATIEVQNYGTIKLELYPDIAPNTVTNFIKLANNGFYDGLTFHRTTPDFMIQGGDPEGDGTGGSKLKDLDSGLEDKKYAIKGEFIANKFNNTLKFEKGVIGMGRSDYSSLGSAEATKGGYNSASSQFFIMTQDKLSIDGIYAGFGKVIEGFDVVDKIANVEVYYRSSELGEGETAPTAEDGTTISSDMPKEKPVITSIRVDTFGADYGMPKTEEPFDLYKSLYGNY